jgi:DNA (cytosine-5)-methyltransferase 1
VLVSSGYGERQGQAPRVLDLSKPLTTIVACGPKHGLVVPVIVPQYGGANGRPCLPKSVSVPAPTITCRDHTSLACAFLTKFYGTCTSGASISSPMPTVTAGGGKGGGHAGLVSAFLTKHYKRGAQARGVAEPLPTVTTKDRFGLVTASIDGTEYVITDIRFRMLHPEELKRAQGFAPEYDLGPARTKTAQVELIGNSVCQEVAEAIVRANGGAPIGQLGLGLELAETA